MLLTVSLLILSDWCVLFNDQVAELKYVYMKVCLVFLSVYLISFETVPDLIIDT